MSAEGERWDSAVHVEALENGKTGGSGGKDGGRAGGGSRASTRAASGARRSPTAAVDKARNPSFDTNDPLMMTAVLRTERGAILPITFFCKAFDTHTKKNILYGRFMIIISVGSS